MVKIKPQPVEVIDYMEIAGWYRLRDMQMPERNLIPPCGLIVPEIAAGFMIKTDAGVVFLEHFITNPRANKEEREAAFFEIAKQFIEAANRSGYVRICFSTDTNKVDALAKKLGFELQPKKSVWIKN